MGMISDIIGTLRNTFRIGKGILSTAALTAARTFSFPDAGGTIALNGVHRSLPNVAAGIGDTTPDPGSVGWAFSTVTNSPIFWDGTSWSRAALDWKYHLLPLKDIVGGDTSAVGAPPDSWPALAYNYISSGDYNGLMLWDLTRWRHIGVLEVKDGTPADPGFYNVHINPVTGAIRVYDGSDWVDCGGGGTGADLSSLPMAAYVEWWIPDDLYPRIVSGTTSLTVNFNDALTDPEGVGSAADPAVGDLIYLVPPGSAAGNEGVWEVTDVSNLAAVAISRHASYPDTRPLPHGSRVISNRAFKAGTGQGFFSASSVDAGTDRLSISWVNENLQLVVLHTLEAGATLPGGLSLNTPYYVRNFNIGDNSFQLSLTPSGSIISITSSGVDGGSGHIAQLAVPSTVLQTEVLDAVLNYTDASAYVRSRPYVWSENAGLSEVIPWTVQRLEKANANFAIALGEGAAGLGSQVVAIGAGASALGYFSTALGTNSQARAYGAIAVGGVVTSTGDNAVALGKDSVASGYGSVAIGHQTSAGEGEIAFSSYSSHFDYDAPVGGGGSSFSFGAISGYKTIRGFANTENTTPRKLRLGGSNAKTTFELFNGTFKGHIVAWTEDGHAAQWEFGGHYYTGDPPLNSYWLKRVGGTNSSVGKGLKVALTFAAVSGLPCMEVSCTGAASTNTAFLAHVETWKSENEAYYAFPHPSGWNVQAPGMTMLTASAALSGGRLVNIWDDSGTAKVRYADASSSYPADGYILEDVSSGALASVHLLGENPMLSGMTVGRQYLGEDGQVTSTVPTSGLSQEVGFALTSSKLLFQRGFPITI